MKPAPLPFVMTDAERMSPLWHKLEDHLTAKLAALREANDRNLDPIDTALQRGRIAAMKEVLSLGVPPPQDGMRDGARE